MILEKCSFMGHKEEYAGIGHRQGWWFLYMDEGLLLCPQENHNMEHPVCDLPFFCFGGWSTTVIAASNAPLTFCRSMMKSNQNKDAIKALQILRSVQTCCVFALHSMYEEAPISFRNSSPLTENKELFTETKKKWVKQHKEQEKLSVYTCEDEIGTALGWSTKNCLSSRRSIHNHIHHCDYGWTSIFIYTAEMEQNKTRTFPIQKIKGHHLREINNEHKLGKSSG